MVFQRITLPHNSKENTSEVNRRTNVERMTKQNSRGMLLERTETSAYQIALVWEGKARGINWVGILSPLAHFLHFLELIKRESLF